MTMINISHGHALPGGEGCGAVGFHDESKETKAIVEMLVPVLNAYGIESHDCSCNKHIDWSTCLNEIIAAHNSYKDEDLSVSLHLNFNKGKEKKDGKNKGIEVLVYSLGGDQGKIKIANQILESFEKAGFTNRGIKERPDLRFLSKCNSPSILVELYFCDDADDVSLAENYGQKGIMRLLATGIIGKNVKDISYGTKLRILKTVKLRSTKRADYVKVGELYKGDVVKVMGTNNNCTRAKLMDGHWITLSAKCVEVID